MLNITKLSCKLALWKTIILLNLGTYIPAVFNMLALHQYIF